MKQITGSLVAMITPMLQDGEVDYAALRKLVDWHVAQGTDCIVAVGTTGESATVGVDEHVEIIRVVVEQANKRIPIMAGCGANSTREAIYLAAQAAKVGADCQLQVVPYYNKPTQEGMFQHFRAIAQAVDLPLYLYNVPGRTVADMLPETALRLAELPGIVGIKEATGNMDRALQILAHAPEGFSVYSGDDPSAVSLMLSGGHGNVSVTANVAPALMHALCKAALAGNAREALALHRRLIPVNQAMFCQTSPSPTKWALARMGLCQDHVRLPLVALDQACYAQVQAALEGAGLLPG